MMFDFALLLDVLFLLVAIYLFPGVPPQTQPAHIPTSAPNSPLPQGQHFDTPLPSPIPNLDLLHPATATNLTPRIVLHPSHASSTAIATPVTLTPRPNHKRKSVSFSISSMNDLLRSGSPPKGERKLHRPATPWMKGPASPSEIVGLLAAEFSPMPSPSPTKGQGMNGRTVNFAGQGSLGLTVGEPSLYGEEDGEETPLLSPKICSRDVVDAMGIKKSWLMS